MSDDEVAIVESRDEGAENTPKNDSASAGEGEQRESKQDQSAVEETPKKSERSESKSSHKRKSGSESNRSKRTKKEVQPEIRAPSSRRVYIANIPYDAKWQDIKDLFREKINDCEFVNLFEDEDGRARGCGIVEFKESGSVKKALEIMDKCEIKGRKMVVKEDYDAARDQTGRIIKDSKGASSRTGGKGDMRSSMRSQQDMDFEGGPGWNQNSGGNKWGNTYGINPQILESLGITPPLTNRVFVANLDYKVSKQQLVDIFRMAGRIVDLNLNFDRSGHSRGHGVITYDHPVEAVQAVSMFHLQLLNDRPMTVKLDRYGADDQQQQQQQQQQQLSNNSKLPRGLKGVGMGLGVGGQPINVSGGGGSGGFFNDRSGMGPMGQNWGGGMNNMGMGDFGPRGGNMGGGFNAPGGNMSSGFNSRPAGNMGGGSGGGGFTMGDGLMGAYPGRGSGMGGGTGMLDKMSDMGMGMGVGGGNLGGFSRGNNMGGSFPDRGGNFGGGLYGDRGGSMDGGFSDRGTNLSGGGTGGGFQDRTGLGFSYPNMGGSGMGGIGNTGAGMGGSGSGVGVGGFGDRSASMGNLGFSDGGFSSGGGGFVDRTGNMRAGGFSERGGTTTGNFDRDRSSYPERASGLTGTTSGNSFGGANILASGGADNGTSGSRYDDGRRDYTRKDYGSPAKETDYRSATEDRSLNRYSETVSATVYVRNLPINFTKLDLMDRFSEAGHVEFTKVSGDGLGLVCFSTEREAQRAINLFDSTRMDGRLLEVTFR